MKGLVCRGLTKAFPGVRALDDVDLHVAAGRVVVLLGENGAGKSTLVKILSGVHPPDAGEMRLDGQLYRPVDSAAAIAAGVAMIHQETNLLPALSVAENVFLGRPPLAGTGRLRRVDHRAMARRAREELDRVGLDVDPRTPVSRLSVAAQQQVEIAKALALDAHVLILDEPTAALGGDEVDALLGIVDDLRARGVALVYISHRLAEVPRIGDEVVVLRDGRRVAAFPTAHVAPGELIEAMVGRTVEQVYPEPAAPTDETLLEVRGLGRAGAFSGVDFALRRGEVLGVAGLVGAGRTELARALFGAEPADTGEVRFRGRPLRLRTPADAVAAGIVLVPEDRKQQGLVQLLNLQENLLLPSLGAPTSPVVRPRDARRRAGDLADRVGIRGRLAQRAGTLSGGNQQKAAIAKWLPSEPVVVILDEPTRGIDVGAKVAVYDLIRELADRGAGVIVISSELPEVLGLANRVLVLSHGRQTALLEREQATEERVMTAAVSG